MKTTLRSIIVCASIFWAHSSFAQQAPQPACKAAYAAPLRVEILDDGRSVKTLEDFGYTDGRCKSWSVPKGATANGASIPQGFWAFVGGPYEGLYRKASVVHDWYCDRRTEHWQDVHRMFYDAMLTSGVDPKLAKLMYTAVMWKGPRWDDQAVKNERLGNERSWKQSQKVDSALGVVTAAAIASADRQSRENAEYAAAQGDRGFRLPSRIPDLPRLDHAIEVPRIPGPLSAQERQAFTATVLHESLATDIGARIQTNDLSLDEIDALVEQARFLEAR